MTENLLNKNQKRRLATSLHLLEREIDALNGEPRLAPVIEESVGLIHDVVSEIFEAFALEPVGEPSPGHRARVLAEVWAMRLSDLKSTGLGGYGAVHPDLGTRLDPLIESLEENLNHLARVASEIE